MGWRLQQWQQQVGEWWEWQRQRFSWQMPHISLPDNLNFGFLEKFSQLILIILLLGLTIWLIYKIWFWLQPYFLGLTVRNKKVAEGELAAISAAAWLARSRQFQGQKNYYQACRCLYFAMLQQLHDRGIISHQSSRTDEEYRLSILQLPQPDPYETLLLIHQQLCFGEREATPPLFSKCQRAYEEIVRQDLTYPGEI